MKKQFSRNRKSHTKMGPKYAKMATRRGGHHMKNYF